MPSKLTKEDVQALLASYQNGDLLAAMAQRFSVDEGAICYHIRKYGLPRRGRTGRPPEYSGEETTLKCTRCGQTLGIESFGKQTNPKSKRPRYSLCKKCCCERKACKTYHITPAQYQELQSRPACAICGILFTSTKLFIDHDHATGRIRGTLCEFCNSGLGSALESPARLELLRAYLLNPVEIPAATDSGPVCNDLKQRRLRVYGLRPSQYDWLLNLHQGLCHCCGGPFDDHGRPHPNIDHHHITGQVRGLLCFSCNIAVGKFKDSPDVLAAAIAYLKGAP